MSNTQFAIGLVSLILAIFASGWLNQRELERQMDAFRQEVNAKFDGFRAEVRARFDTANAKFDALNNRIANLEVRVERIERQLEAIFKPVLPRAGD